MQTPNYYRLAIKPIQMIPPKRTMFMKRNTQLKMLFNYTINQFKMIKKYHKGSDDVDVIKILHKIIPLSYFGCIKNRQLFDKVVKKILTQSAYECIYACQLYCGFDHTEIPWLQDIQDAPLKYYQRLIFDSNVFMMDKIVKPLIYFFYKVIRTYNGQEIIFKRRKTWAKMESRAFAKMLNENYLIPVEDQTVKTRGRLKLIPKGNQETFRPIICIFEDSVPRKNRYKLINKGLYGAARKVVESFKLERSLYTAWTNFVQKSENLPIFGVKLDIEDAFGRVDMVFLSNAISHTKREFLSDSDKQFIYEHINNQYITYGRKNKKNIIWKWQHGLIQGDRLSAPLCELFLSHMDNVCLKFTAGLHNCFFHRTVDDYFFCSTDRNLVDEFKMTVSLFHKINEHKIAINYGPNKTDDWIPYCGNSFNLTSREVKKLHHYPDAFFIRHKFKLWNFKYQIPQEKLKNFVLKAMKFCYNNGYFLRIHFNTIFNGEERVLRNFYESMIVMAYKFDCAVMAVADVPEFNLKLLKTLVKGCILEYATRSLTKIKSCVGDYYSGFIGLQVLIRIGFRAFLYVFKRRPSVYFEIIDLIQKYQHLYVTFPSDFDYKYFTKLPEFFRLIKMNRALNL